MFLKKVKEKKESVKYKLYWFTLSVSILFIVTVFEFAPGTVVPSSRPLCKPLVSEYTHSLIRSFSETGEHHGYNKVIICGQVFFQSLRTQGFANHSSVVEEYADYMLEKYGTGFLDF